MSVILAFKFQSNPPRVETNGSMNHSAEADGRIILGGTFTETIARTGEKPVTLLEHNMATVMNEHVKKHLHEIMEEAYKRTGLTLKQSMIKEGS